MESNVQAPLSSGQSEFNIFLLNAIESMTLHLDKNEKLRENIRQKLDSNIVLSRKSWEESVNKIGLLRKNLISDAKGSSIRISRLEEAFKCISNEQKLEIEKIVIEKMKKALNKHDEAQFTSLKSIISNQNEKNNNEFVVINKKMLEFDRTLMEVEARLGGKIELEISDLREEMEKRLSKLEKGIGMLLNYFSIPYE